MSNLIEITQGFVPEYVPVVVYFHVCMNLNMHKELLKMKKMR